jgi:hypothetical protein
LPAGKLNVLAFRVLRPENVLWADILPELPLPRNVMVTGLGIQIAKSVTFCPGKVYNELPAV